MQLMRYKPTNKTGEIIWNSVINLRKDETEENPNDAKVIKTLEFLEASLDGNREFCTWLHIIK